MLVMDKGIPPPAGWSFFDRAYCISLRKRADRREAVRAEFARVGLVVEFVMADKAANPEQGIYESHLLCLQRGQEAGAQRILVFEDDVLFRRFSADRLAQMTAFLETAEWDAFFLGCLVKSCHKLRGLPVARIRYRSLTHAYAVNRSFAAWLVEQPWRGLAYDDFLCSLPAPRFFAACPAFAFQSDSPSDNDACLRLDRLRRRFGGLLFLQQLSEFGHRFWWQLMLVNAAALVLLAFALWRALVG